ncbi:10943_t:CDS:2 [Paraglomus occultum]|uniref:10943_t:CDS:1 n=1 Tax=Paraglomus occultum TaxID=144539 RepID=A0A9N9H501_9GLOM|nr:10943_t:CDS:2 [Paraglomus occultum]
MNEAERRERMRQALDNASCLFDRRFKVQFIFVFDEARSLLPTGREMITSFLFDVLMENLDTIDDTSTASATVMDPMRLTYLGRPPFRSYIQALDSQASHQDILTIRNLARSKLVRSSEFSSKPSMIEALSVLSVRLCLDVVT